MPGLSAKIQENKLKKRTNIEKAKVTGRNRHCKQQLLQGPPTFKYLFIVVKSSIMLKIILRRPYNLFTFC